MQKKALIKELKYFPPQDIVSAWPADFPLLFLGGDSKFAILPIEFYETEFASLSNSILNAGKFAHELPFISGVVSNTHTTGNIGLITLNGIKGPFDCIVFTESSQ